MKLTEFVVGQTFWMSGSPWRCTDIGTRVVVAIKLDEHADDSSWFSGPPYAVVESVIDEISQPACTADRVGSAVIVAHMGDGYEKSRRA